MRVKDDKITKIDWTMEKALSLYVQQVQPLLRYAGPGDDSHSPDDDLHNVHNQHDVHDVHPNSEPQAAVLSANEECR
jgi:hypothetical protein